MDSGNDFDFEDSLHAIRNLSFDSESVRLTFVSEEDVAELIGTYQKTAQQRRDNNGSHFSQLQAAFFSQEDFANMSHEIKGNLIEDNIYSTEFIERLPSKVPERLQRFINSLVSKDLLSGNHKHDHDHFYTKFSCAFSLASDYFPEIKPEEANLFLFTLAKSVLFHVKRRTHNSVSSSSVGPSSGFRDEERGPLAYVAGSVLSQIYKKAAFHKSKGPWQAEVKSLFATTLRVQSDQNAYIAKMDRGGLWAPSAKVVSMFEVAEKTFRGLTKPSSRSIPIDEIIKSCLSNPSVIAIWNSILMDHEETSISEECAQTCLSMLIKFFVRVRGFSHTKDIWKRHLDQQQLEKKQKALRKTLKKKAGE